jgi:superfamily II DNA or RNA helicase
MNIELYPHQRAAVNAAHRTLANGRRCGLWVMPTGTGKTRAFVALARELDADTLVVVHRDELARQAAATFGQFWPEVTVGMMPGRGWEDSRVVIATVQSLHNKLDHMPPDRFELVVLDEAHHAPARSWEKVIEHFTPRLLLGVTATPERLDGKDLAAYFGGGLLYAYPLGDAMRDDYVVPIRQYGIRTEVSLDDIPVRAGDFSVKDLARVVSTEARTRAVIEAHREHAADRLTLVFAVDLAHVEQIRAGFLAAGVPAASVTGKMPLEERRQVLADFGAGRVRVLVNYEVLTEGYDERGIGAVIMARPTKSRTLYQQCVGRGLRAYPEGNKADCLVLDVIDRSLRHRVVVASDLFGAHVPDCGGGDIRDAARAEKARWRLEPLSPSPSLAWRWESGEDTPWPRVPDLNGYRPRAPWELKPASPKQIKLLTRGFGFEVLRPLTKGEASHLIEECKHLDQRYPTPATDGQVGLLRAHGRWRPGMSKREAAREIGQVMRYVN